MKARRKCVFIQPSDESVEAIILLGNIRQKSLSFVVWFIVNLKFKPYELRIVKDR